MKPRRVAFRLLLVALIIILGIGFYMATTDQQKLPETTAPDAATTPG